MSVVEKVLRFGAVAVLIAAGCGSPEPDYGETQQALCSATCTCGTGGVPGADAYANFRGSDGSCADPALISNNRLTPLNSAIDFSGDEDWFSFRTTTASGYYSYSFITNKAGSLPSTTPATDTYCEIFASPTTSYPSRANNNNTNDISPITGGPNCMVTLVTSLQNRTFYLRVRHASGGTGPYALYRAEGPTGEGDSCSSDDQCAPGTCVEGRCVLLQDSDMDGYPDPQDGLDDADNCPTMANEDQADCDIDGIGDVCDTVDDSATTGGDCSAAPEPEPEPDPEPADTTPPVVTVPADITAVAQSSSGNVITFSASAEDDVDGPLAASCTPASGSLFHTGSTTVTCEATDAAGNTGSASFTVNVHYSWSGVLAPINPDGSSLFKLGRTIPVKFMLTDASATIADADARITLRKISDGISGAEFEATSTAAATSGNQFRYDPDSGIYVFNLSTAGLTSGTWEIGIKLLDGIYRTVIISLK